jgi:hypothetical protein
MPAQARDDARPVVGACGELVFLERVDFVANEAGDGLGDSLCVVMQRSLGEAFEEWFGGWRNDGN